MNIIVHRTRFGSESMDGEIFIDGTKICDCAENAFHCLQRGSYRVKVQKCKFHSRKMPCIVIQGLPSTPCDTCNSVSVGLNSPHPYCPQICPGNGVFNRTDGSILVGQFLTPGCLSQPKSAFNNLYQRIRKSAERGNSIFVTIEEHYPLVRRSELTNYEWGCKLLALM